MASPPPCTRLGRQCRALDVTLRVAALEGGEDHDGTWLFGHVERLDFGATFEEDDEIWAEATIHVPCRYLRDQGDGTQRCGAWGFEGTVPAAERKPAPRRLGADRFAIFDGGKFVTRHLPPPAPAPQGRALPIAPPSANPCAGAPCRTADNRRGAACCRDLQVQIRCTDRQTRLEALVRSRKSPLLCKTEREEGGLLNVEVISACGFLQDDGLTCDLHGRTRSDGRPAKPLMCSAWPEKRSGLHPGCAFRNRRLRL
ncbi:MAG: hypothetical protein ABIR59_08240 [Gemmatimonadales bacterium]